MPGLKLSRPKRQQLRQQPHKHWVWSMLLHWETWKRLWKSLVTSRKFGSLRVNELTHTLVSVTKSHETHRTKQENKQKHTSAPREGRRILLHDTRGEEDSGIHLLDRATQRPKRISPRLAESGNRTVARIHRATRRKGVSPPRHANHPGCVKIFKNLQVIILNPLWTLQLCFKSLPAFKPVPSPLQFTILHLSTVSTSSSNPRFVRVIDSSIQVTLSSFHSVSSNSFSLSV